MTDPNVPTDWGPVRIFLVYKSRKTVASVVALLASHIAAKPDSSFWGLEKGTSWAMGHIA